MLVEEVREYDRIHFVLEELLVVRIACDIQLSADPL
jgi:hypothetical protein